MGDINYTNASQLVSLVGVDAQGAESNTIRATINNQLATSDTLDNTGTQANLIVGLTAIEVKAGLNRLVGRKQISLYHLTGVGKVYFGYNSSVTVATGTPIAKLAYFPISASDTCQVWLISDTANQSVRITEV